MATAYEIVMESRKQLVEKLIANMEKGYFLTAPEWNKALFTPFNPESGAKYKGGNRLRLMLAAAQNRYEDCRWLTFNQLKEAGYSLEKGSKGVLCEKWIFTKTEIQTNPDTGLDEKVEVPLEKPKVSYFTVFNASQIKGIGPYQPQEMSQSEMIAMADTFIKSSECKIEEKAHHEAFYSLKEDRIVLPVRESFKDEISFLKTTLHEMGHSTGHPDRLDRDMSGVFGSESYAREEIRAELASFFTENDLGIRLNAEHFNDHSNYLKSWIAILQNDPNELFRACQDAQAASERLIANYEHSLEQSLEDNIEHNIKDDTKTNIEKTEQENLEKETIVLPVDPDSTITDEDMVAYGYEWAGMAPIREHNAKILWNNNIPIYKLMPDDTEISVESIKDISNHAKKSGIFGVEKDTMLLFIEKLGVDKARELLKPPENPNVVKIDDFGEKIGGAKKDLWKERGLIISDTVDMNDAERDKYIKKDNVWKKMEYQKMMEDGLPPEVVWFYKQVRDKLSSKPIYGYGKKGPEDIKERQNGYIEFVSALRDAVLSCKTIADIQNFRDSFLVGQGYVNMSSRYHVEPTEKCHGLIDNKLWKACYVSSSDLFQYRRDMEKEQFGIAKEDRVPRGFQIRFYDGSGYSKNKDWTPNTFYVTKGYTIVATNLETREAALAEAKAIAEQSKRKTKKAFVPKQLEHIRRIGLTDVRNERNMTGNDYLSAFGFKGGEFGNWMSEKDRQASLNMGYEALYDLAKAINISLQDISLGNNLSIAFGSRGSGNAAAHYEPMREVINLTKMNGAGSLAHEWGHAMDDILAKKLGLSRFMSEDSNAPESMKKLMETIKYRPATEEEKKEHKEKNVQKQINRLQRNADYYLPDTKLSESQIKKKQEIIERLIATSPNFSFVDSTVPEIEELSELKKEATGHVIPKEDRTNLFYCALAVGREMSKDVSEMKVETKFYQNSKKMDTMHSKCDKGYWASEVEMFARAFACYVHDKIYGRSDYLCGHSEAAVSFDTDKNGNFQIIKAIPEHEERIAINRAFDRLFNELRKKELLHSFEKPMPSKEITQAQLKELYEIDSSLRI